MQISFGSSSSPVVTKRPPGTYCVVNPDYEQVWSSEDFKNYKRVSRPTRNGTPYNVSSGQGLPATARFVEDTPVRFARDLQFYVHGLCSRGTGISEQEKKNSFRSLWRDNAWMSNFAGTMTRADYINENGLPPYIQIQPMATGGALLKIVGETRVKRTDCWLIEAINPDVEFESYDPDLQPWLFFRPTLSIREWIFDKKNNPIEKREWFNEPFPQYGEASVVPVFGFLKDTRLSTGWMNVIEKYRVRVLSENEPVPNPFRLRYGRTKINPYEGF